MGNTTQNLVRFADRDGVDVIEVSPGRDSADFVIVEEIACGDILVTQDLGLAAMVLGRGARPISPRGRLHTAETIDMELEFRHAEQKHRRGGGRTQGPPPFEVEDREHFVDVLERLLDELTSSR